MPGSVCPNCGELTFFNDGKRSECTRCGTKMKVSINAGRGGKGKKCPNCKKHTIFGNSCNFCGATFTFPKSK